MSGAQRLQESLTDSRDHAIRKNYKGETECLLIHKVIMPKVSQMKSVRNVSRSGEKGGPPAFGWWWKVESSMLRSRKAC